MDLRSGFHRSADRLIGSSYTGAARDLLQPTITAGPKPQEHVSNCHHDIVKEPLLFEPIVCPTQIPRRDRMDGCANQIYDRRILPGPIELYIQVVFAKRRAK